MRKRNEEWPLYCVKSERVREREGDREGGGSERERERERTRTQKPSFTRIVV